MTEIPAELLSTYGTNYIGYTPEQAHERALAAVLPAHERMVRARLATELHEQASGYYGSYCDGMRGAADYVVQDAPTAPAQPAAPATGDAETTGGAGGGTDDLSALRDRITQTLMQWYIARAITCEHTQLIEFGPAADAVMDDIWPVLDDLAAARNAHRNIARIRRERANRWKARAEQAERERDQYLDGLFRQGELHEHHHPRLSKRACTNCAYFRELRQDPHYAAARERWRAGIIAAIEAGNYIACRTPEDPDGDA